MTVHVILEVASKRSFASAVDWPGWSRGAKTAEDALENLLAYAPRYARVARRAKLTFRKPATVAGFEVVERLTGDASTEFGVPRAIAAVESDPVSAADLERLLALLRASWATFDAAARSAEGVSLATGPRGGGRSLAKIIEHVRDAEAAYLRSFGSRSPSASEEAPDRPMKILRATFVDALTAVSRGEPLANPNKARKRWPARYAVRRAAWHILDHAWELEDRSG
jgi:hypothetical protein